MFIPPDPHFFGFLTGLHEEHVSNLLSKKITKGGTCIDVGANIGYFTSMMSHLAGKSGRVFAFEPVSDNFCVLAANAELNASNGGLVTATHAAVSDVSGRLNIARRSESTLHEVKRISKVDPEGESVPAIALDELMSQLQAKPVDVLKVDVEGHELSVIRGSQRLISERMIQNLVIEVTPGSDAIALEHIFANHGGRVRAWLDGHWHPIALASLSLRTDVLVEF